MIKLVKFKFKTFIFKTSLVTSKYEILRMSLQSEKFRDKINILISMYLYTYVLIYSLCIIVLIYCTEHRYSRHIKTHLFNLNEILPYKQLLSFPSLKKIYLRSSQRVS